jgi:hypothetical protein
MQPRGKLHFEQLAVSALHYLLEWIASTGLNTERRRAKQFLYGWPDMINFGANAEELNTLGQIFVSRNRRQDDFRRPRTEPLNERFAKIGTHEVHHVKCKLVNGLPPRYGAESSQACRIMSLCEKQRIS